MHFEDILRIFFSFPHAIIRFIWVTIWRIPLPQNFSRATSYFFPCLKIYESLSYGMDSLCCCQATGFSIWNGCVSRRYDLFEPVTEGIIRHVGSLLTSAICHRKFSFAVYVTLPPHVPAKTGWKTTKNIYTRLIGQRATHLRVNKANTPLYLHAHGPIELEN